MVSPKSKINIVIGLNLKLLTQVDITNLVNLF